MNKKTTKKYILKIFGLKNKNNDLNRILNEIYMSCTLYKLNKKIFPKFIKTGFINNLNIFGNFKKKYNNELNIYPFIITEFLNNYIMLSDYLQLKNISKKEKISVLFSLIYNLHNLYKNHKFYHNDLHANNILVNTNKIKQSYNFNKKKYILNCPDIKIIDLDKSSILYSKYKKKKTIFSYTMLKSIIRIKPSVFFKSLTYKNSNKSDLDFIYTIIHLFNLDINIKKFTQYKDILNDPIFNILIKK